MRYLCIINGISSLVFVAESLEMARDYMRYYARENSIPIHRYQIFEIYMIEERNHGKKQTIRIPGETR